MDPLLSELKVIDFDAGSLFSGQASGRMIKGFAAPCPHTPTIDPDYLFHDAIRELVVWFISPADPLYVFGPTGSGKTSLIRQVAAKLNYPVFDVTGHGGLEFNDLAGHLSVDNGSMSFQYGPLALAMKFGGLFLLNELDLLDPSTVTGLNGVLDGAPLCIPENGGEVIPPHPMFRFVATANTNGAADDTGLYQGTLRQNLAFMDRFWLCEIGYPVAEAEEQLLERRAPALPADPSRIALETLQSTVNVPPTHFVMQAASRILKIIGVLFDNARPGRGQDEAILADVSQIIEQVIGVAQVVGDSAFPLANDGHHVLIEAAGPLDSLVGRVVAVIAQDDPDFPQRRGFLKRLGKPMPGRGNIHYLENVGLFGEGEYVQFPADAAPIPGVPLADQIWRVHGVIFR